MVDLATLTGANAVALGKRTAALYSHDDELAAALAAAGADGRRADLADAAARRLPATTSAATSPTCTARPAGGAGSVVAALYLREFTGPTARPLGAHRHVGAVVGRQTDGAELAKGATGWGVRTLLRWLASALAADRGEQAGRRWAAAPGPSPRTRAGP